MLGTLILLIVATLLIVRGIQGLTSGRLEMSRKKVLTGSSAKTGGVLCIVGGVALLPLYFTAIFFYQSWLTGR